MPGGKNKLRPEDNPKPFSKNNLPTDEMRKKAGLKKIANTTFVSKLVELLNNDGELILSEKLLIEEKIDENKKRLFIFKLPNIDSIVIRWILDAQSGHSNLRTRARETLVERIEGKPPQHVTVEPIQRYDLSKLSIDELKSIAAAGNGRSSDRNVKKKSV